MMDLLVLADILGTIGGVLLGICLIPEIKLIHKHKSADDVSYSWLLLYQSGLLLTLVYMVLVDALVGWVTILVEVIAVFYIMFLKFYFSNYHGASRPASLAIESSATSNKGVTSSRLSATSREQDSETSITSAMEKGTNSVHTWAEKLFHRVPKLSSDIDYRGMHSMLDYVFCLKENVSTRELSNFVFEEMQKACNQNQLRMVHKHLEVFSDEEAHLTPPGFTSVCLIDESHVSAHCYSKLGMLAIDVFTCGNLQNAQNTAESLHRAISSSPLFERIDMRAISAPRFPNSFATLPRKGISKST